MDTNGQATYRTYRMDLKNKRIVGMVDGIDAAIQSVFKILQTRRFAYLIYDNQYGCDIYNKIGNSNLTPGYLDTDMPAMVEDAFLNESMVLGVSDFEYEITDRDGVCVSFVISTIFGDSSFEGVVSDG